LLHFAATNRIVVMSPSTLSRIVPTSFVGRTATAGALALGLAYVYNTSSRGRIMADSGSPRRVFTGGPAFLSLLLESSEDVNHNTKKLRFGFPDKEAVSGLSITCNGALAWGDYADLSVNNSCSRNTHTILAQRTVVSGPSTIHAN
jgi:hypothetical protein